MSQAQEQEDPLGREPGKPEAAKVDPNHPLGRDSAEIEEMYGHQRIESTLTWLRGMSHHGGMGLFGGGIFGPGGPRRLTWAQMSQPARFEHKERSRGVGASGCSLSAQTPRTFAVSSWMSFSVF